MDGGWVYAIDRSDGAHDEIVGVEWFTDGVQTIGRDAVAVFDAPACAASHPEELAGPGLDGGRCSATTSSRGISAGCASPSTPRSIWPTMPTCARRSGGTRRPRRCTCALRPGGGAPGGGRAALRGLLRGPDRGCAGARAARRGAAARLRGGPLPAVRRGGGPGRAGRLRGGRLHRQPRRPARRLRRRGRWPRRAGRDAALDPRGLRGGPDRRAGPALRAAAPPGARAPALPAPRHRTPPPPKTPPNQGREQTADRSPGAGRPSSPRAGRDGGSVRGGVAGRGGGPCGASPQRLPSYQSRTRARSSSSIQVRLPGGMAWLAPDWR